MNLFRTRNALALSGWFGASLLAAMTASAAAQRAAKYR